MATLRRATRTISHRTTKRPLFGRRIFRPASCTVHKLKNYARHFRKRKIIFQEQQYIKIIYSDNFGARIMWRTTTGLEHATIWLQGRHAEISDFDISFFI